MGLLVELGNLFGIQPEPPLTESEIHLLNQLQRNRDLALKSIPNDMKDEFLSSIYSDKNLQRIVKIIYRDRIVTQNNITEITRNLIAGHLGLNGFGKRLDAYYIVTHNDNSKIDEIYEIMLHDINL